MYSYTEIAIINAAMIVPLAIAAEVAGRLFRRPALTHILWVLILVKLITPPVWQVPLVDHAWLTSTTRQFLPPVLAELDNLESALQIPKIGEGNSIAQRPKTRLRTLAEQNKRLGGQPISQTAAMLKWVRSESFLRFSITILQTTWSLGALIWFIAQGCRCVRFRWSLARGYAAPPELQRLSHQMARQLGLAHSPTVWLMPGIMSPMLWGNGQSTLLIFPERLLQRLRQEATGTLLAHELAHYKRGDHWVRIIALMATGFFWWHPIVWWARREIEAVEEECCDALVLKAATTPPKCYAEAILDAVDFLAELQHRLPPLATGLGEVPFLRQRLTWIMRGPRSQQLGYFGRVLCLALVCTLPLQPTWISAARPFSATTTLKLELPNSSQGKNVPAAPTLSDFERNSDGNLPAFNLGGSMLSADTATDLSRWRGVEVKSHSFDGRFVVLGNKLNQYLLDLTSGKEFDLGQYLITAMAFTPDSHVFATIGGDHLLRTWDAETCKITNSWQVPGNTAKSVDISSNGEWIVTGGNDGVVRIWNSDSPTPARELPKELAPVNCVRFSAESGLLAIATGDSTLSKAGRIALYDVDIWTERISMNWNSPTAAIAFRSDGETLVSGDWKGRIAKWNIASGELVGLTTGQKDAIELAVFSPNGSTLAEISIPDLPPDATLDESQPSEPFRWLFKSWPAPKSF